MSLKLTMIMTALQFLIIPSFAQSKQIFVYDTLGKYWPLDTVLTEHEDVIRIEFEDTVPYNVNDILRLMPSLTEISFSFVDSVDLDTIIIPSSVTYLEYKYCDLIKFPTSIKTAQSLTHLSILGSKIENITVEDSQLISCLSNLLLYDNKKLKSIDFAQNTQIENLQIIISNITEFENILRHCPQIKKLTIILCPKITFNQWLLSLNQIEYLYISDTEINNLDYLELLLENGRIKDLGLVQCGSEFDEIKKNRIKILAGNLGINTKI